jgi:hypothetical protein
MDRPLRHRKTAAVLNLCRSIGLPTQRASEGRCAENAIVTAATAEILHRFGAEAAHVGCTEAGTRYRYVAKEWWRLAAVDASPKLKANTAEYYSELAEAEELTTTSLTPFRES